MKKIVDFTVLDGDAMEMKYFGRAVLTNGVVTFEDCSAKFVGILNEGVLGRADDGFFYPRDGLKFMEALHLEFSGSAIRASAVREEE